MLKNTILNKVNTANFKTPEVEQAVRALVALMPEQTNGDDFSRVTASFLISLGGRYPQEAQALQQVFTLQDSDREAARRSLGAAPALLNQPPVQRFREGSPKEPTAFREDGECINCGSEVNTQSVRAAAAGGKKTTIIEKVEKKVADAPTPDPKEGDDAAVAVENAAGSTVEDAADNLALLGGTGADLPPENQTEVAAAAGDINIAQITSEEDILRLFNSDAKKIKEFAERSGLPCRGEKLETVAKNLLISIKEIQ